jgi:hypothetical protein
MPLIPLEQSLLSAFGQGRSASDRGDYLSDNPHAYGGDLWWAWWTGWQEQEGPAYIVTARGAAAFPSATLADIWPTPPPGFPAR